MSMSVTHAGAKDHPITLIQCTVSRGPYGGVTRDWENPAALVPVRASRSDRPGTEDYEGAQVVASVIVTWRIWFREDINAADWRVRDDYSGKVYDVEGVRMIGRRQELELRTEIKDNA